MILRLATVCLALASAGAVALPTPARPHRRHTNPLRADREFARQRLFTAPHGPPDAGPAGMEDAGMDDAGSGTGCDFEFGDCFWWIGSTSSESSGLPNDGVRTTMSAVDFQPDGGCFDCWTSEYLDNGFWGQVGFSACNFQGDSEENFTVFYQTWNADAGLLLVDGESTFITEGLHTFTMNLDAGTKWDYSVDGTIFGSYDMGSAAAAGPYAISTVCEEGDGVAAAFVPPTISVPVTMQVDNGGQWSAATAGLVYNSAGISGVEGNLQSSALANDQTVIGGSSTFLQFYTPLWSGAGSGSLPDAGIVPVTPAYVAISAPAANSTVSGTVLIAAQVYCPAGSTVYFWGSDQNAPTCTLTAPPWNCSWDTTQYSDGTYYPLVQVQDLKGNLSWADITVTVDNSGGSSSGGSSSGASSSGSSSSSGGSSPASSASTSSTTAQSSAISSSAASSSSFNNGSSSGGSSGGPPPPKASCNCAAGGSPMAALPLLVLAAFLVRRRRAPR
jgi:MYXO-CTERM domain-containing protein